ncbi:MAG: hypothetical protein FIA92_09915 [Chloroflexi bacterium]|nr:hypothetical protein [Chloroflexota bacterium]
MGQHDAIADAPGLAGPTGMGGRLAGCPACGRTFDIDMRRIVALPVDLRLCPTCNHLRDIQRNELAPQLLVLSAGWAGAIAAGHVVISAVAPRPADLGSNHDVLPIDVRETRSPGRRKRGSSPPTRRPARRDTRSHGPRPGVASMTSR